MSKTKRRNTLAQATGTVIRRRRLRYGMSQRSLGELAGLTGDAVSLIERGERCPNLDTIFRLADVIAPNPEALVMEIEEELGAGGEET